MDIVVSFSQDEVTAALIDGEVDAMSADSPVTGFAIKLSRGDLVPAGDVFDSAPYGWPVRKGSELRESLRLALEHLMESGEYRAIATMWGVERGMIEKAGDQRRHQIGALLVSWGYEDGPRAGRPCLPVRGCHRRSRPR